MLKRECLARLDDGGEATVFASSNYFSWLKLNWSTAVTAFDFLSYIGHGWALKCSRFRISLATITPEAEA